MEYYLKINPFRDDSMKSGKMKGIIAIFVVGILLFPAAQAYGKESFHVVKKLKIDVGHMVFNTEDNLIYTFSLHNLYVLDSVKNTVKENITIIDSSYSPIYKISGIGYNSQTHKIYLSVYPNEVIVLSAGNYSVLKKIKLSSTENENYGAWGVYVDENINTIYVRTSKGYTVINGKNDSMVGIIPCEWSFHNDHLDLKHSTMWFWNIDKIIVRDLRTWNVVRIINITNKNYWFQDPWVWSYGDRVVIEDEVTGYMLEYSTDNYRFIRVWNVSALGLYPSSGFSPGAYDSQNHILYATFGMFINLTVTEMGIMAIDMDNLRVVAEMKNVTWTDTLHAHGELQICGVNPKSHYLYVSVKNPNESKNLLIYSLGTESNGEYAMIFYAMVGVVVAIIAIVAVLYLRKRK